MNIVGKDVVGCIFKYLDPVDWCCVNLVCKSWNKTVSKWMNQRKKIVQKHLLFEIQRCNLADILSDSKKFCLIPIYHLQSLKTGCDGTINNFVCKQHKLGEKLCEKCHDKPISENCYGELCDSEKCKDYMYILREGTAVKVKKYSCIVGSCKKGTDVYGGCCRIHAINIVKSIRIEKHFKSYRCLGINKSGKRCSKYVKSRNQKCHIHRKKILECLL